VVSGGVLYQTEDEIMIMATILLTIGISFYFGNCCKNSISNKCFIVQKLTSLFR
jgi:hypothetical protein